MTQMSLGVAWVEFYNSPLDRYQKNNVKFFYIIGIYTDAESYKILKKRFAKTSKILS